MWYDTGPARPARSGPRIRRVTTAVAVAAAVLCAILGAPHLQTPPDYLATAVTADGADLNIEVRAGVAVAIVTAGYDAGGHAALPAWSADAGAPFAIPAAPRLGWDFPPAVEAAAGRLNLRVCLDELRAYDRDRLGRPGETEGYARRVLDELWSLFEIPPFIEVTCDAGPHWILAPSAGEDCRIGARAWGCAALIPGAHLRISFNGDVYADNGMGPEAVLAALGHEVEHAFLLAHTSVPHGHRTCLTGIQAPDGPAVGVIGYERVNVCPEDFEGEDGHPHLGIQRRAAAPPPRSPAMTRILVQWWREADAGECVPPQTLTDDGQWCLSEPVDVGPAGAWVGVVRQPSWGPAEFQHWERVEP